jgi:hypothetical protein
MASEVIPKLTAIEAQTSANGFLNDHMPDRYLAVEPRLDSTAGVWCVKVALTYPFIGSVGEVGEIAISAFSEEVLSYTPLDEMRERGRQIYKQHREAIHTDFSQAGN